MVLRLVVSLVVMQVARLMVRLVVRLVRWPRPFLVLPNFKPQPGLFTNLAHLPKQGRALKVMMSMRLIVNCESNLPFLPSSVPSPFSLCGSHALAQPLSCSDHDPIHDLDHEHVPLEAPL